MCYNYIDPISRAFLSHLSKRNDEAGISNAYNPPPDSALPDQEEAHDMTETEANKRPLRASMVEEDIQGME